MCGVVGFIRKNFKTHLGLSLEGLMSDLLFMDTLRGAHSTGFFAAYKDKNEIYIIDDKDAMSAGTFMQHSATFDACAKDANNLLYFVGHNRYATGGKINRANAHPFTNKHVTLVHNGIIRNRAMLTHDYPEVDSMAITEFFANGKSKQEFINIADGAYALVWQETDGQVQLHFLRNDERPMWFIDTPDLIVFGSEKWMLAAAMERNRLKFNLTDMSELPVYEERQYVFDKELTSDVIYNANSTQHKKPPERDLMTTGGSYMHNIHTSNLYATGLSRNARSLSDKNQETIFHKSKEAIPLSMKTPNLKIGSYIMFCYSKYETNYANGSYGTLFGEFPEWSKEPNTIIKGFNVLVDEVNRGLTHRVAYGGRITHLYNDKEGRQIVCVSDVEVTFHHDPIWEESYGLFDEKKVA